ncbi:Crp/Fnr family transcriptional regulator [Sphingomonas metalli]|uniref:Crp/Fnr family transcriptional regulator n=1 Tax=Sphingomonas metalli TaxID=1779358 RepID=A0A916WY85_9SPHN|nr:Crp/Fnr family transcriptional regulator [Sphingomonas metalli]GGB38922.1 Crp/Fnr family transcriptional regulator [Sphingomonas metalli]
MSESVFADRLTRLIALSPDEHALLTGVEERERRVRRNGVLFSENDRVAELFVLRRGMMMSYVLLDDGSRQIQRFLFPGDLIATTSLVYAKAPDTVMAVHDSSLGAIDRQALADVVLRCPRIGLGLLALEQVERVAMSDRLAAVGRTSAKARVAALLLELRNRLRATAPAGIDSFAPGITQEEMGDATGLTAVHVNRMIRQLEEERLIGREGGRFTIRDEASLVRIANYIDRYAGLDMGWLTVRG